MIRCLLWVGNKGGGVPEANPKISSNGFEMVLVKDLLSPQEDMNETWEID